MAVDNETHENDDDYDRKPPAKKTKNGSPSRPVPVIRNPYANKGRYNAAPTKIAPTTKNPSGGNNSNHRATTATKDDDDDSMMVVNDDPIMVAAKKDSTSSPPAMPPSRTTTMKEGDLPFWERMPTQTTSLKAAEVLTMAECLQYRIPRLYCEHDQPIRVTGTVKSRSFLSSDSDMVVVELKLGDTLARKTAPSSTNTTTTTSTPSALKSAPRRSLGSSASVSKRVRRNRPWFVSSNNSNSNSNINPSENKAATQAVAETLSVLADATIIPHLDSAVVGSFVTVTGDFVSDDPPRILPPPQTPRVEYKLEARTLVVASAHVTTDMALYETALTARRTAMYQRYHRQQAVAETQLLLLQGCGPPPYDAFSSSGSGKEQT